MTFYITSETLVNAFTIGVRATCRLVVIIADFEKILLSIIVRFVLLCLLGVSPFEVFKRVHRLRTYDGVIMEKLRDISRIHVLSAMTLTDDFHVDTESIHLARFEISCRFAVWEG